MFYPLLPVLMATHFSSDMWPRIEETKYISPSLVTIETNFRSIFTVRYFVTNTAITDLATVYTNSLLMCVEGWIVLVSNIHGMTSDSTMFQSTDIQRNKPVKRWLKKSHHINRKINKLKLHLYHDPGLKTILFRFRHAKVSYIIIMELHVFNVFMQA